MFNRAIQVKMVKTENKEDNPLPTPSDKFRVLVATTNLVSVHTRKAVMTVGKLMLLYIAADTVRQVAVAKASK